MAEKHGTTAVSYMFDLVASILWQFTLWQLVLLSLIAIPTATG